MGAMEDFMKQKKDGAKQVLDKMNSATDSGLVEHVMSTWAQKYKDDKEARKMEEIMAENEARFGNLCGRQKDNAKGVAQRTNEQMDLNCMLKHFSAWATDTKLERIMRHTMPRWMARNSSFSPCNIFSRALPRSSTKASKGKETLHATPAAVAKRTTFNFRKYLKSESKIL